MFAKTKITGVSGSTIVTGSPNSFGSGMTPHKARQQTQVRADTTGMGQASSGAASMSMNTLFQSQYQYMLTGILPADPINNDSSNLALFYRDCYLLDSTAGSAVDIQSVFPFSDWELRGLEDQDLIPYHETLEQLSIRQMMPEISTAYLVDGFFCGSLIYDQVQKLFRDTLVHDALQCQVIPSPFYNVDPAITVNVANSVSQFLGSQSVYAKKYLNSLPKSFLKVLNEGSFTLDPVTTLFIARKGLTDRAFTSYLHRVLPMYLIEKTMFRGTLVEATKRQRATSHVTAGDDTWTPTGEELQAYIQAFQAAEMDPLGGWVATRNAVQVQDIRTAGDMWKWTDMADVLVSYKMRALGISEALLSGDASYAAAESAYSTFLETMGGYRSHLTSAVFYRRIFPLVAVTRGLFKDARKAKRTEDPMDFLYNANNTANLKIPQLYWHKSLEAKEEDNLFDMLEKASDHGVPVPLKMWMAAANIDRDTLIRDLKEDKEFTATLNKYKGETEDQDAGAAEGSDEDFDNEVNSHLERLTSTSIRAGYRSRVPLAARNFNAHDIVAFTKTGQRKHVLNQESKKRDYNGQIAKIAARMQKDPQYRAKIRQQNIERLGRATLA